MSTIDGGAKSSPHSEYGTRPLKFQGGVRPKSSKCILVFLRAEHAGVLNTIRDTKDLGDDAKAGLKTALDAFAKQFA